ncbi:MAG: Rv1355c family protein [Chitinophagaceae bacterium]
MREIKTIPAIPEFRDDIYQPEILDLDNHEHRETFDYLLATVPYIQVYDEIDGQLRELIKSMHPSRKIRSEEYPALISAHLQGSDIFTYGVWVYYPWSARMIHLLAEEEFIEVRTNRNRYKITREEQAILATKKLGIVGLSVGQSIALTLAIERTCGELRLADFDTVELSNLNRMRCGLHNLGIKKTVIAAREISEIDPFLKVVIYNEGLKESNLDDFFLANGKLDMLVEVCDGLDVKIISRFRARELGIPVVMDTNDRGMLDIERFDLEPDRPILHGLAGDLDPFKIADLTNEEKIPYILTMIGANTISTRLKASMLEVEQSINTWPQLASSVTLGGALTTDVCRNIFLDHFNQSGRFYIDMEEIIKSQSGISAEKTHSLLQPPPALTTETLESIASAYEENKPTNAEFTEVLNPVELNAILEAACLAPSGGNAQPWKFLLKNDRLFICHDAHFSFSLLDYNKSGSMIAFGAMLENIEIKCSSMDIKVCIDTFPLENYPELIAVLGFNHHGIVNSLTPLAAFIGIRNTNRIVTTREPLRSKDAETLQAMASTVIGASLAIFESESSLASFNEILTNTERLRFLHPQGHYDTFVNEIRFTPDEIKSTADGLDVNTLNMKPSEIGALSIAKDPAAISFLRKLQQGKGFKKISSKNILTASAICVLSMPDGSARSFFNGGRALERVWLEATRNGIGFQPISQITFMTELLSKKCSHLLNAYEESELVVIENKFRELMGNPSSHPVFVFRLFYSDMPVVRSLRKPLDRVLVVSG